MILAAHLDSTSVLVAYGLMQLLTGLVCRLPMPVQPFKAVATLVITQHIGADTIFGAGLAIGLAMLLLTLLGGIDWRARMVPKSVVRGIQLGAVYAFTFNLPVGEFVQSARIQFPRVHTRTLATSPPASSLLPCPSYRCRSATRSWPRNQWPKTSFPAPGCRCEESA